MSGSRFLPLAHGLLCHHVLLIHLPPQVCDLGLGLLVGCIFSGVFEVITIVVVFFILTPVVPFLDFLLHGLFFSPFLLILSFLLQFLLLFVPLVQLVHCGTELSGYLLSRPFEYCFIEVPQNTPALLLCFDFLLEGLRRLRLLLQLLRVVPWHAWATYHRGELGGVQPPVQQLVVRTLFVIFLQCASTSFVRTVRQPEGTPKVVFLILFVFLLFTVTSPHSTLLLLHLLRLLVFRLPVGALFFLLSASAAVTILVFVPAFVPSSTVPVPLFIPIAPFFVIGLVSAPPVSVSVPVLPRVLIAISVLTALLPCSGLSPSPVPVPVSVLVLALIPAPPVAIPVTVSHGQSLPPLRETNKVQKL
eukprot:Hpha_TRINITY_DN15904_c0_g3::TRINITY_DN15904_c0_g3_i1::g.74107::m.74107